MSYTPTKSADLATLEAWRKDIFLFCREAFVADDPRGYLPSEPLDGLKGKAIRYELDNGTVHDATLFDRRGRLVYHDLKVYTKAMFKKQERADFTPPEKRFTWQQTVMLTAYQRAIDTFDQDAYDTALRTISGRSGHGIGKTAVEAVISIHVLTTMFGACVGATANTSDQLQDILLKEIYVWKNRLPEPLRDCLRQTQDGIEVDGMKDTFLRARTASKEKPEALAGLHAPYVVLIIDEASAVDDKVFEVMKGSLTGGAGTDNVLVLMFSNPTRLEGEFFNSHKEGGRCQQLAFSSEDSPIVSPSFVAKISDEYGENSDEYRIRVKGEFPAVEGLEDGGWVPLLPPECLRFVPDSPAFTLVRPLIGTDPSGSGRDSTCVSARDAIYLKLAARKRTTTPLEVATISENIAYALGSETRDISVDAFGVGAESLVHFDQRGNGGSPQAVLMDKPRDPTDVNGNKVDPKEAMLFNSYKAELAWRFRTWLMAGGRIITNNEKAWRRELEPQKYRRTKSGRIELMHKVEFKKRYGFSPDRFDSACLTFHLDSAYKAPALTGEQKQSADDLMWLERVRNARYLSDRNGGSTSSMG